MEIIVARALLLVGLLGISYSMSSFASDFSLAYELSESMNNEQKKAIKIHVKQKLENQPHAKEHIIEQQSAEDMMDKNEAFISLGTHTTLPQSHTQADVLLSEDTWRINPLNESTHKEKPSLRARVMQRDLYEEKRTANDFLLFSLPRGY